MKKKNQVDVGAIFLTFFKIKIFLQLFFLNIFSAVIQIFYLSLFHYFLTNVFFRISCFSIYLIFISPFLFFSFLNLNMIFILAEFQNFTIGFRYRCLIMISLGPMWYRAFFLWVSCSYFLVFAVLSKEEVVGKMVLQLQ